MPENARSNAQKKPVSLLIGANKLTLFQGDIAQLNADAVVCPVNQSLDTQAGISQILLKASGGSVKTHKPVFPEPYGKVVVLPGGKLNARYIFLTVLLGEKGLDRIRLAIRQSVERSIRYAEFLRLKSIAFPVLGSPQVAPPYEFIAREMMENVAMYFRRRQTKIKAVFFSIYNGKAFDAFRKEAEHIANL